MTASTPAPPVLRRGRPLAALGRLLLAAAVLIPCVVLAGPTLQRWLLPVTGFVFEAVAPDLKLRRLEVSGHDGERRLQVTVTLARITLVGEKVLMPDPRGEASAHTPAGHAWIAPLVAALALAAWPARHRGELWWRLGAGLPMALLLGAADPALMLAATIWQLLIDSVAPGTSVPLAALAGVLLGGGRIVLGLAAATAIIGLATRLAQRRPR